MKLTNPDAIRSITREWEGERDGNGRPLVPDDVLRRMELVTSEEAWGVLRRHGYHFNFAGDFQVLHPERVLVGRAVTCRYVPIRPDLQDALDRTGVEEGRIGNQNSWVIDELVRDDVIVVDLFGKVRDGTFAGDNLATAIKVSTNRGMVIDGGIRDAERILQMPDFNGFIRGMDPSSLADVSMPEINGVVRIGEATCLPGDVVLGRCHVHPAPPGAGGGGELRERPAARSVWPATPGGGRVHAGPGGSRRVGAGDGAGLRAVVGGPGRGVAGLDRDDEAD